VSTRLPHDPIAAFPLSVAEPATGALLAGHGAAAAATRAVADALPTIVWTATADGRTTAVNRRWEAYTGQPADAAVGGGFWTPVHPDDLAAVCAAWHAGAPGGARAGEDFAVEYRLRSHAGEYRWHLGRLAPRRAPDGTLVEWVGMAIDVHEQRAGVPASPRAAEDRFLAAHEVSPNGLHLLTPRRDAAGALVDLDFAYVNGAGARLLRRVPGDMLGRGMREVFASAGADVLFDAFARVVATGEPFERELAYPPGEPGAMALHVSAVRVGDGLAVACVDVTPRVRALEAAERAREEAARQRDAAAAANEAKAQFLAAMSHELRTPLNAIGGYVQLLDMGLHGPVTGEQQAALSRVARAQQHLLGLINDILNYAKLESGRVEYDLQALDVAGVVAEVAPLIEPQLTARAVAFEVALPASVPAVWADREKLRQILLNLLSNAAKFTDPGGRVRVDVSSRRGAPDAGGGVHLRVSDTGVGVPRDKQEAIFEPFVQVRADRARLHEGTGLGLAISRDLARGMGGDLRVRSAPGTGSTFTVTLRRAVGPDGRATERRVVVERRLDDERRAPDSRRREPGEAEGGG
jgi:PAS domain S-box-containing protein